MTNWKSIFLEMNALLYAIIGLLMMLNGISRAFALIFFIIAGVKLGQAALSKDERKGGKK